MFLLSGPLKEPKIFNFKMTTSSILRYPTLDKECILDTDASGTGKWAVLSQIGDDGKQHVILAYEQYIERQTPFQTLHLKFFLLHHF